MKRLFGCVVGLSFAAVLGVGLLGEHNEANACAMFGKNARPRIQLDFEEGLVVWDESNRMEHFIRSASFLGVDDDFGFVVPTPNRPALTEVDEAVFTTLAEIYTRREPVLRGAARGLDSLDGRQPQAANARPVTVVEVAHVAGMDATVLRASDAGALATWLSAHGLVMPPGSEEWLAPYVRDGWHLTAFQYRRDANNPRLISRAVRMSFRANHPYFPYSEPSHQRNAQGRRFRLTVVAPYRVEGFVGGAAWDARVGYAGKTAQYERILGPRVPPEAFNRDSFFTTFDMTESHRGEHDLYFQRSTTQDPVAPSITVNRTVGAPTRSSPPAPVEIPAADS